MALHEPLPLLDRLRAVAQLWASATGRSLGALSSVVLNHGSFFERLESPEASATTATLEKFARFLGDSGNWPDGAVPEAVAAFVHVVGVTPAPADAATGQIEDLSGRLEDAA